MCLSKILVEIYWRARVKNRRELKEQCPDPAVKALCIDPYAHVNPISEFKLLCVNFNAVHIVYTYTI